MNMAVSPVLPQIAHVIKAFLCCFSPLSALDVANLAAADLGLLYKGFLMPTIDFLIADILALVSTECLWPRLGLGGLYFADIVHKLYQLGLGTLSLISTFSSQSQAFFLESKTRLTSAVNLCLPYFLTSACTWRDDVKYATQRSLGWHPLLNLTP
jgi:hypothetical protein